MNSQEKEIVEKALKSLIDIGDRTADCARTAYCSVGANEPICYALADTRLSLKAAREAVHRATAIVNTLSSIQHREES